MVGPCIRGLTGVSLRTLCVYSTPMEGDLCFHLVIPGSTAGLTGHFASQAVQKLYWAVCKLREVNLCRASILTLEVLNISRLWWLCPAKTLRTVLFG